RSLDRFGVDLAREEEHRRVAGLVVGALPDLAALVELVGERLDALLERGDRLLELVELLARLREPLGELLVEGGAALELVALELFGAEVARRLDERAVERRGVLVEGHERGVELLVRRLLELLGHRAVAEILE